jgi:hypothetical protein
MLAFASVFLIFVFVAAVLVAVFSGFVVRAYRLTRRPWLVSFCFGFALLEVSFLFVLLNRYIGETSFLYHGTLWVHQVIQTAGFGLIAATYYLKDRILSARRSFLFGVLYVAVLGVSLALYFAAPGRTVRSMTDEYVYGIGLALVAYSLSKALRGTGAGTGRAVLVPSGFGAFAVGQAAWVYWGITDADAALLLAGLSLPLGLALLTATVLKIWRGR